MVPKTPEREKDLIHYPLREHINLKHPLVSLAAPVLMPPCTHPNLPPAGEGAGRHPARSVAGRRIHVSLFWILRLRSE
jgi:hypothetical protein